MDVLRHDPDGEILDLPELRMVVAGYLRAALSLYRDSDGIAAGALPLR